MRDHKRFEEPEPLRPRNSFKQGSDKSMTVKETLWIVKLSLSTDENPKFERV